MLWSEPTKSAATGRIVPAGGPKPCVPPCGPAALWPTLWSPRRTQRDDKQPDFTGSRPSGTQRDDAQAPYGTEGQRFESSQARHGEPCYSRAATEGGEAYRAEVHRARSTGPIADGPPCRSCSEPVLPTIWCAVGFSVLFNELERKLSEVGPWIDPKVHEQDVAPLRRQIEAVYVVGPPPFDPAAVPAPTLDAADDAIVYRALLVGSDAGGDFPTVHDDLLRTPRLPTADAGLGLAPRSLRARVGGAAQWLPCRRDGRSG